TVWQLAAGPPLGLFRQVNGSPHGLTEADASHRLACDGENRVGPRAPATFTASVRRRASPTSAAKVREVPVEDLVVGDVVLLATGDPVPADLRLLTTSGLTVDQSPLSGLVDMVPKWAPELGPSAMATV